MIDYGNGDAGSIAKMLQRIESEAVVGADPTAIQQADRLILAGAGASDSI